MQHFSMNSASLPLGKLSIRRPRPAEKPDAAAEPDYGFLRTSTDSAVLARLTAAPVSFLSTTITVFAAET